MSEVTVYIVGVNALRRDLARDVLDPGDSAIYLFLSSASAPLFYPEAIPESPLSDVLVSVALALSFIVVAAIGVWRCYLANGGRRGHRFAERFLALAWVVNARLLMVALPALFVVGLALDFELSEPFVGGLMLAYSVIYFWRIWAHLTWVASQNENAA